MFFTPYLSSVWTCKFIVRESIQEMNIRIYQQSGPIMTIYDHNFQFRCGDDVDDIYIKNPEYNDNFYVKFDSNDENLLIKRSLKTKELSITCTKPLRNHLLRY